MPRKARPLDRTEKYRDASLVIIASEDTYAVRHYFARFKNVRGASVLPTEDGKSSPERCATKRLVKYVEDHPLEENDALWLCIDRNGWHRTFLTNNN